MRRIYTPGRVKAVEDTDGVGTFEAIVAVFGNTDLVNDRVVKGAFAKSLDSWRQKSVQGDRIPVVWTHDWDHLDSLVGDVIEAEERDEGLWVKAQLDMEEEFAQKLFRKLQKRRVREFSFAYDVIDERRGEDGVNELLELEIIEVGPTFKGANPATRLLSVKSDVPPLDKIRDAVKLLGEVLASQQQESPSKADEPETVKVEDSSALIARGQIEVLRERV